MNRRTRRMVYTVAMSMRGQFTMPVALRKMLGLRAGSVVEVRRLDNQRFAARVVCPSRILDYAGDLKDLDESGTTEAKKGHDRP